ncbi:MAG: sensor histidine kinase [Eubacterium sp.]|nr:sensor histidine kinase [Eubacterium sp.]
MDSVLKKLKNMSFRKKMLLFILVISIVPLLVMGIFSYGIARQSLVEREQRNMRDYMSQSILGMENKIDIYNNLSDYIAYNQTISNVIGYRYDSSEYTSSFEVYKELRDVVDPLLSGVKYFNQDMDVLTIYVDSDIVKHDSTIAPLSDVENALWKKKISERKDSDIYWFVEEDKKKAYLVRRMPLLEDMESEGYLYIEVKYDSLFEMFSQIESSKYGIVIYNDEGEELYSFNSFKNEKYILDSKVLYDSISSGDFLSQKSYKIKNGNRSFTVVKKKAEPGWTVAIYKPYAVVNTSIRSIISVVIIVSLVCILLSSLISTIISTRVVDTLEKMTDNMKAVEAGDYEVKIHSDSEDEIGTLIRGFGNMVERINTLINEVYKGKLFQKEAEMKALQAQINPHFLYNSLSLINWKAIEAKQPDISRITLLLSKFYRTSLNKGKNITSIKDEISNIQSYIDIQLMMHDNGFDVEYDLSPEILDCSIPNLLLQPLIENAIDHGIDLNTDKRGIIKISGILTEDSCIRLTVSDNGVGMPKETAELILTENSKGYGVKNVNERIKHFYGEEYGITVESTEGEGTDIIILIPLVSL